MTEQEYRNLLICEIKKYHNWYTGDDDGDVAALDYIKNTTLWREQ